MKQNGKIRVLPALLAIVCLTGLAACASSKAEESNKEVTPVKMPEIEGVISAKGEAVICKTENGDYELEGSLVAMIQKTHNGKKVRLAGQYVTAARPGAPGVFKVKEIVVVVQ